MDHQFTKQIQAWLNAKHESDADIKRGADILFRLNRDRFYHARATRQPQAYRSNIEYELGKFLKIRLAGMLSFVWLSRMKCLSRSLSA